MLIKADNSETPSHWLWALGLAYRTVHAIMVIGLPILLVIGLFWGMIIFISYEPQSLGQDPRGRDSKFLNKFESTTIRGDQAPAPQ